MKTKKMNETLQENKTIADRAQRGERSLSVTSFTIDCSKKKTVNQQTYFIVQIKPKAKKKEQRKNYFLAPHRMNGMNT